MQVKSYLRLILDTKYNFILLKYNRKVHCFLPVSSSLGRFLLKEGLVWAVFWCAWNGAILWNTSPQVVHLYSRWAARRSWTCFSCRNKCDFRLNFLSHLGQSCCFSLMCICWCCFKLSARVNTFLQVGHSCRVFLTGGDMSTSSYKINVNRINAWQTMCLNKKSE